MSHFITLCMVVYLKQCANRHIQDVHNCSVALWYICPVLDKRAGLDTTVARISTNGLGGAGFTSRYQLHPIAGF